MPQPLKNMLAKKNGHYIQFKKTLTNKEQVEMVRILAIQWMMDETEVLYQILREGLLRERKKQSEIEALRRNG